MNERLTLDDVRACPHCGELVRVDKGTFPPAVSFDERVVILSADDAPMKLLQAAKEIGVREP
jgi:hypothetical protein